MRIQCFPVGRAQWTNRASDLQQTKLNMVRVRLDRTDESTEPRKTKVGNSSYVVDEAGTCYNNSAISEVAADFSRATAPSSVEQTLYIRSDNSRAKLFPWSPMANSRSPSPFFVVLFGFFLFLIYSSEISSTPSLLLLIHSISINSIRFSSSWPICLLNVAVFFGFFWSFFSVGCASELDPARIKEFPEEIGSSDPRRRPGPGPTQPSPMRRYISIMQMICCNSMFRTAKLLGYLWEFSLGLATKHSASFNCSFSCNHLIFQIFF